MKAKKFLALIKGYCLLNDCNTGLCPFSTKEGDCVIAFRVPQFWSLKKINKVIKKLERKRKSEADFRRNK